MNLVVRADADARIGTGHFMRCLALAQRWTAAGGRVTFVTDAAEPWMAGRLDAKMDCVSHGKQRGSAEDARFTASLAAERGAEWIVADGYAFDAGFHAALKSKGARLLAVDDLANLPHYSADLVLNLNPGVGEGAYPSKEKSTRLLLGGRYFLLREEFLRADRARPVPAFARRPLLTFGGSDPANATEKAMGLFAGFPAGTEMTVVVGGSNPHGARLEAAAAKMPFPVKLLRGVPDMAALMGGCDLAFASVGTTCWELAYMGLPACVTAPAAYQEPFLEALGGAFAVFGRGEDWSAGSAAKLAALAGDAGRRARMAEEGRRQIDGKGAERVVAEMMK